MVEKYRAQSPDRELLKEMGVMYLESAAHMHNARPKPPSKDRRHKRPQTVMAQLERPKVNPKAEVLEHKGEKATPLETFNKIIEDLDVEQTLEMLEKIRASPSIRLKKHYPRPYHPRSVRTKRHRPKPLTEDEVKKIQSRLEKRGGKFKFSNVKKEE